MKKSGTLPPPRKVLPEKVTEALEKARTDLAEAKALTKGLVF